MSDSRLVIVTAAIMLETSIDDDVMDLRLDSISADFQVAVRRFADQQPDCRSTDTISFHYLDEHENATRCAACGRWASDFNKPNGIDGIGLGASVNGRFLCTQCYSHKPAK